MQYAVMRPAEIQFFENLIRIADEIAIGEKQKLDQIPVRLTRAAGGVPPPRYAACLVLSD